MTVYSLLFDDIDKHISTPFGDVVWVKQKIANCADYNSDYTEITNKEDCLEVVRDVTAEEFLTNHTPSISVIRNHIAMWKDGNTTDPSLPKGCSVATSGNDKIGSSGNRVAYQTLESDAGTTYMDGNRLDLKFCINSSPSPESDDDKSDDDKSDDDNKESYLLIFAGICICLIMLFIIGTLAG